MQYFYGTTDIAQKENSIVVLGNFDGVHIGHQKLFKVAREKAKEKGLKIVVFSFYPHPSWVIGTSPKALIMSRRDKEEMIKTLQIDTLIEYPFTKAFATLSAKDFFVEILVNKLKAEVIIIGSNYYFGKGKEGNKDYLCQLGNQYHKMVCVVEAVKIEDKIVSSSVIRDLIFNGEVATANKLLGHPYSIIGQIIEGKKLGRTIGFPTLNIAAEADRVYPPKGVYATKVKVYNEEYLGMTNIGYNPTVSGRHKMIETHLFDFEGDLYGKEAKVCFYHYIRPEKKFDSFTLLAEQIQKDKKTVQQFFKSFEK